MRETALSLAFIVSTILVASLPTTWPLITAALSGYVIIIRLP
jgi:hypothetical protein